MAKNRARANKIKAILRRELDEYMSAAHDLSADEAMALRGWVATGNSVYDNPHSLCDESGRAMDFIGASRLWDNFAEEHLFCMLCEADPGEPPPLPDDGLPF